MYTELLMEPDHSHVPLGHFALYIGSKFAVQLTVSPLLYALHTKEAHLSVSTIKVPILKGSEW